MKVCVQALQCKAETHACSCVQVKCMYSSKAKQKGCVHVAGKSTGNAVAKAWCAKGKGKASSRRCACAKQGACVRAMRMQWQPKCSKMQKACMCSKMCAAKARMYKGTKCAQ